MIRLTFELTAWILTKCDCGGVGEMTDLPDLPDIDADFSESTHDADLEALRQQHEPFLTRLEALAVCAIRLWKLESSP